MNSYILRSEDKLPKSDYQTIALLLLDKLKQCYDRTVLVSISQTLITSIYKTSIC